MAHASVCFGLGSTRDQRRTLAQRRRGLALEVLRGMGEPRRGQWWEDTGLVTHLRRRLTTHEDAIVGPLIDIRGTDEMARRLEVVRQSGGWLPPDWKE